MKSIALHILDIAQNSIRAAASEIRILVKDSCSDNEIFIKIEDNGSGIPEQWQHRVTDPFFTTRTTRKTGFGLALLRFHAELTGGCMKINCPGSGGTVLEAAFVRSHIDRQPLGDLPGVIAILSSATEGPEIEFIHNTDKGSYRFSTKETKDFLGAVSLAEPGLANDLREMIEQNILELYEVNAE